MNKTVKLSSPISLQEGDTLFWYDEVTDKDRSGVISKGVYEPYPQIWRTVLCHDTGEYETIDLRFAHHDQN